MFKTQLSSIVFYHNKHITPIMRVDPSGNAWWNPFSWSANTWGAIGSAILVGAAVVGLGALAVATGIMDNIQIPGLNSGRGSFQQVSNQIRTKFWNGTIRRVTGKTVAKMSTLVLYQTSLGAMVNGLFDAFDWNDKFASLIHW